MKIINKTLALTLISTAVAQSAHASGWGIGLNVGQSSLIPAELGCEIEATILFIENVQNGATSDTIYCDGDDTDTSVGIHLNYDFTDRWGIELGYIDLGESTSTIRLRNAIFSDGTNSLSSFTNELSAFYLVGTGTLDLSGEWSLTGRLGAAQLDLDSSLGGVNVPDDVKELLFGMDSETEAMAGISLNYQFNKNWSADIRYDYFDTDETVDSLSLGAKYSF